MLDFLGVVATFVSGLFSLSVPGIGITYGQLLLGLWVFYAVGQFVFSILHGDDGGD